MVFRVVKNKDNPFVTLHKASIYDAAISWKAKGILAYILSRPDTWQVYESEVCRHSKDGIKATRSGFHELIRAGYITRTQKRLESGHFSGYEYLVYETPQLQPIITEVPKPENGKRHPINNDLNNNDVFQIDAPLPSGIYDTEQARNQAFAAADLETIIDDMEAYRISIEQIAENTFPASKAGR